MTDDQPNTLSAQQLTAITGLTDRHLRRLATQGHFPQPTHGRYNASDTLIGFIKYQAELLRKKNSKLAKEQLALTKAKRERAQEDLAEFRGKYVAKADIGPALRNVSLHQRATLQRLLEQELAPKLAGLTTIEILEKVKEAVDEVCQVFREGIGGWMYKPPEPGPGPAKVSEPAAPGNDEPALAECPPIALS